MLQVDHAHQLAARQDGHRQEGFVAILRQLVEGLEARVVEGVTAHGDRLRCSATQPVMP